MHARWRRPARQLGIYLGLALFLLIALFPVLWMVITAFKDEQDLYQMKFPLWFHMPPTLKHFRLLFTQTWFGTWVVNSALLSIVVVAITLAASVPAAYALARLRLPGAHGSGTALFMTYLVPPIILFIPIAPVVGWLGLFDSWWALVLLYPTFTIPLCTWLMLGFFLAVPRELEESAWIDGCGMMGGILRVVLPLSLPGMATTAIFAFTLSMQEYLYAVVFAAPVEQKVVTVGLPTMLIRGDIFFWGALMAGGLLVGLPTAIAFNLVLDRFIQGLTGTGDA
ncbi:MAG TPA: carbohydrate ABC transporter permease [Methylomirabilota bacterium]|nr:carbohydrate ABC transporter permease [Methylomirabilota bacterium]